ncbi:MAG: phospholipase A [Bdellovibrionota bacterium]
MIGRVKKYLIVTGVFVTIFCSLEVHANSPLVPDPNDRPPLFLHRDNYLLVGGDTLGRSGNAVFKFQISGKFQVLWSKLYIAYTQRSFMALRQSSFPFYDHNFEPEIFYNLLEKNYHWFEGVQFGLNHQSNGKAGADSRSWNRAYAKFYFENGAFYFRPGIYIPFLDDAGTGHTESLAKYMGVVSLETGYRWKKNLELSAIGKVGSGGNRGSIQVDFSAPFGFVDRISKKHEYSRIWFQAWYGYGESLIGFDQKNFSAALGVGFRS